MTVNPTDKFTQDWAHDMRLRVVQANMVVAQLTHLTYAEASTVIDRIVALDQAGMRFEFFDKALALHTAQSVEGRVE